MTEEIIRSEYLYRGQILKLRLDQVRLPGPRRRVVMREVVEHRGAVAIVALDAEERVVLVRQYRSAAGCETLEIPAGTLEVGEDPALCATRELTEETGYHAAKWEPLGFFYSSPGFSTEKMHLFLAGNLTAAAPAPEDDEAIAVAVTPFADALEKIERGEIVDAKSIVGLLRVWKMLKERGRQ